MSFSCSARSGMVGHLDLAPVVVIGPAKEAALVLGSMVVADCCWSPPSFDTAILDCLRGFAAMGVLWASPCSLVVSSSHSWKPAKLIGYCVALLKSFGFGRSTHTCLHLRLQCRQANSSGVPWLKNQGTHPSLCWGHEGLGKTCLEGCPGESQECTELPCDGLQHSSCCWTLFIDQSTSSMKPLLAVCCWCFLNPLVWLVSSWGSPFMHEEAWGCSWFYIEPINREQLAQAGLCLHCWGPQCLLTCWFLRKSTLKMRIRHGSVFCSSTGTCQSVYHSICIVEPSVGSCTGQASTVISPAPHGSCTLTGPGIDRRGCSVPLDTIHCKHLQPIPRSHLL